MAEKKWQKTAFFVAFFVCAIVFAFLLHRTAFPFFVLFACTGYFFLCRENEQLGLLAAIFLLPLGMQPQEFLGGTFARFQDFLLLTIGIEFFLLRATKGSSAIVEKNNLLFPLAVFFAIYLLSAAIAVTGLDFSIPFEKETGLFKGPYNLFRQTITVGEWLLVFFLCSSILKTKKDAKKAIATAVLTMAFVGALAAMQHVFMANGTGNPNFSRVSVSRIFGIAPDDPYRISSLMSGPNSLGSYIALLLPFAVAIAITVKKIPIKFLALVAVASGILALLYCGSRASWIAVIAEIAACVSVLFCLIFFAKKEPLKKAIVFFAAIVFAMSLIFLSIPKESVFFGREINISNAPPLEKRIISWKAGIEMVAANPAFGIGPGLYSYYFEKFSPHSKEIFFHSHNTFLQIALEAGIIALAAFLLVLAKLFSALFAAAKKAEKESKILIAAALLGIFGFFLAGMFGDLFSDAGTSLLFWAIAAISLKL